ncbi:hypothetical protein [Clostridium botulinum]|uniref:hypothetical protein n=1 Tax=Clostridium botulinum TaxID=1491 RepID=UPI00059ED011|nr:hypothetical protein [Clostridium botulinum]KIN82148.1 hypothetical protein SD74_05225 [Clostridium botulinum]MCC5428307.1 hypothetical protein [Clostridium botulinum]MCC5437685.1 hypothetical protein [Clostridium botulinum]
MNPFRISKNNIKAFIDSGNYELTGLLETGEITIAIVSDLERDTLKKVMKSSNINKEQIIKDLNNLTDNRTNEILEIYKQLSANETLNICKKNGLRIKV